MDRSDASLLVRVIKHLGVVIQRRVLSFDGQSTVTDGGGGGGGRAPAGVKTQQKSPKSTTANQYNIHALNEKSLP
jgi:hypothetical protein